MNNSVSQDNLYLGHSNACDLDVAEGEGALPDRRALPSPFIRAMKKAPRADDRRLAKHATENPPDWLGGKRSSV